MRTTLLGRLLLPSAEETLGPERFRQLQRGRMALIAFAMAFDLSLYFVVRDGSSAGLRGEAIRLFVSLAVPLLAASLLLTALFLRRPHRFGLLVQVLCIACEAAVMIVWVQLSGTVSSYFLVMAFLLILLYRLAFGYWLGVACAALIMAMHASAFALESAGVIPLAWFFVDGPSRGETLPLYRIIAFSSIQWCYLFTLMGANFVAAMLREKDRVASDLRRDLDRAVAEQQAGRLSGQTLGGKYELGELLGRGGMGEVYQARRASDGREVAVKVLLSDLSDQPTARERFRREAEVIARLPTRCVAELLDMGESEGHDYIVMELLRGEDFGAVLRRRGSLPLEELCPIASRIAAALDAAHDFGIIHRDLKPSNLFVTGDDVRLLDFGIARLLEADSRTLTMTQVVLGSPGYLAPEQARAQSHEIGPHTDVFALGAILYRALTGRNAFPSRNPVAAAYEALCHQPPPPSSVREELPRDVDCVLAIAMAKKIDDRYPRASRLARDLERAADGSLDDATRARARTLAETAPPAESTLTGVTPAGGVTPQSDMSPQPTVAGRARTPRLPPN